MLVDFLNQVTDQQTKDVITLVEEKFEARLSDELALIRQEMSRDREETTKEFAKVRQEMTTELAKVRQEMAQLRADMGETKADIIKWMFIFWVGQLASIIGILFVVFRK